MPNQVGLALLGNITAPSINLSGGGFLGIGGQSANFTGPVNVNAGGLAFTNSAGGAGAILGGQVVLAANTVLDTRGNVGDIGSLASTATSASVINGLQGTAGTLTLGLDNVANVTFAGTISSPYPTGLLNITKIGTGVWTLTNNSTATNSGTLTVSDGGVTLNGSAGVVSFTNYTVQPGGTLLLDDSVNAVNNRLGGSTLTTTAAVLAPTNRALNMNGGNLTINGNLLANGNTVVNEAIGNIASLSGGGIITLNATGTGGVNLTIADIIGQSNNSSLLLRGDGLGTAAGSNVAAVSMVNPGGVASYTTNSVGGLSLLGGQGANGTTTKSIRPDILVDTTATGLGAGFLTVDTVTGLIRPLGSVAGELATTLTTSTSNTTNVGLSSVQSAAANVAANSITLQSGGGVVLSDVAGSPWGPAGLLTIDIKTANGVLALASSGATSFTSGQIQSSGNVTGDYNVETGATLTFNTAINSQNGFVKAGGGTLVLNGAYYTNTQAANTVTINGGTIQLGATVGANALFVQTTATTPAGTTLAVNNGTFDLNGNNQLVGVITTTNPLPYAGGTAANPFSVITNSSATAAVFSTNAAASVIGTVFSGNLSLDKSGNNTMSLSSAQTYTGATTIRGGNITLRDAGALASTAITANYAELTLDNTFTQDLNNRISASATVNLTGGALRINTTEDSRTENFGTIALNSGANLFYAAFYSNNGNTSAPTYNIANLTQSNNATLNIESPYSTALGNFTGANAHVYISQLNGAPFNASSMVDGIIAPWFVVSNTGNAFGWATYSNTAGVTLPNTNGTANYAGVLSNSSAVTDNSNTNASVAGITARTINSLASIGPGAATIIGMNTAADQLVIASGGILLNDSGAKTIAIQGGSLTAGSLNAASTLYLNSFVGTDTINSPIVNNGTGPLTLVRSGSATLNLTPQASVSVPFAASAAATTSLTVPSTTGLFVGMAVSGGLITANTTITAITGNVLTLSLATAANGTTAVTNQISFAPVTSTSAVGATTAGSNTVSILASNLPAGFTPAVGMILGSSVNLPGGDTITVVSLGTTDTFTLAQNATTTSAAASLVFNAMSNNYTGGTVVNSAVDTYAGGTTNLSGFAGSITIPGNLTINGGATVTEVANQGQIATTSAITINGSGTLNLVGTNRFSTTLAFNNSGGNATPTVAVGTLMDLSSTAAITAANDNTAFTNTISGTTLNFSSPTGTTINTSGLSGDDLIISAAIATNAVGTATPTGAAITKTGAGSLILPNANAASLTWVLSGGSVVVNNGTSLGVNATAGALTINNSVGLLGGTAAQTVALPIIFNAGSTLTLGGSSTLNQITLSGGVNLNGATPTIATAGLPTTDTISGVVSGAGGFIKAGPGALTLSNGGDTLTGAINVAGGLLTQGAANAFGSGNTGADYTIGSTAEININAFSLQIGSLSGGGILTNTGAAQTLTIGAGGNTTNATFSGALMAATAANLAVSKVGGNTQTLSG